MSLTELKLEHDSKFSGPELGESFELFQIYFKSAQLPARALAIRKALSSLFKIRVLDIPSRLQCWHDVLRNVGPSDHYQSLSGVCFVGLYFAKSVRGTEAPTHFFVRETDNFRGTLDTWKNDLVFPSNTTRYTVCAVVPDDFSFTAQAKKDPRNYRIPTITRSNAKEQGLDLDEILPFLWGGTR